MCILQDTSLLLRSNLDVQIDVAGPPTVEFQEASVFYLIQPIWPNGLRMV